MFDVGADLAALVVGEAIVAIAVMLAQEAADRIIGILAERSGLIGVQPIEAGVAQRHLRLAARRIAARHGDRVDDRARIAGIDRGRAAAHDLDMVGHQVLLQDRVAPEEDAVIFVEQRQAVLLEADKAAIIGQAADTIDILHFAAGDFGLETGQLADQIGEIDGGDLLDIFGRDGVDRIGYVEATLGAGRAGDDDIALLAAQFGRLLGGGCILRKGGREEGGTQRRKGGAGGKNGLDHEKPLCGGRAARGR